MELIEKDKIEQYLNFYSDARASFSNLDDVISLIVHVKFLKKGFAFFFNKLIYFLI